MSQNNYSQYQQQLVQSLLSSSGDAQTSSGSGSSELETLLNAIPTYQEPAWQSNFYGILYNLLQTCLPNDAIAPQPSSSGMGGSNTYSYAGSYSGYQNAFYGEAQGAAATKMQSDMLNATQSNPQPLNAGWWNGYALALLTDSVFNAKVASINSNNLTTNLSVYHQQLLTGVTAAYISVLHTGYSPTSTAFSGITDASNVLQDLKNALQSGAFNTNVTSVLGTPGDGATAAEWLLYNIWSVLYILEVAAGSTTPLIDVDNTISGLSFNASIPTEIQVSSWYTGAYSSWYAQVVGSDLLPVNITASMPQNCYSCVPQGDPPCSNGPAPVTNGYSASLCNWGPLNAYNPPPSSCFGKGTGVLMSNLTVKPIEEVLVGDEVYSSNGPRKVVLIESPLRKGRALLQINGENVFATEGHPFRAAKGQECELFTSDPWQLMDGIPTMTSRGIGTLKAGVQLEALINGNESNVTLKRIEILEARNDKQEQVYDLLLENWEKDHPAYFVGGPEIFFATESETVDPSFDKVSSVGIITALKTSKPLAVERIQSPLDQYPILMSSLRPETLLDRAARGHQNFRGTLRDSTAFPKPDFYMENGQWSEKTSYLEYYLVRQHGRLLRSLSMMGWKTTQAEPYAHSHLVVDLYDIELLGDYGLSTDPSSLQLTLANNENIELGAHSVELRTRPSRFNIWMDDSLDLGNELSQSDTGLILGKIVNGNEAFGRFRLRITPEQINGTAREVYIFNDDNTVIGRIMLGFRWISQNAFIEEKTRQKEWTNLQSLTMAASLGKQVGHELIAELDTLKG